MIDLTNAPKSATHYAKIDGDIVWYMVDKVGVMADDGRGDGWCPDDSRTAWLIDNLTRIEWPVELIDGQAYQFEYYESEKVVGVYDVKSSLIHAPNASYPPKRCKNITRLIPEVKS